MSPGRAWRCGMRDFVAELAGDDLGADPDPNLARIDAMNPQLAREAIRTIWVEFYDPKRNGPPYDPDCSVNGGDLVEVVGNQFSLMGLVPEAKEDAANDGS